MALVLLAATPTDDAFDLSIHLVGNAGVMLSDGRTTLLVDLPYESGAFGYERYDPSAVQPTGTVVSVITHHHRDHFDPGFFAVRTGWQIIGPPSVVNALPSPRVLPGDSITVGDFTIVAIATPHTPDHRSYRIGWRGRTLYFVGDTEQPGDLFRQQGLDLLFITPWLQCTVVESGRSVSADRSVMYHRAANDSDRRCGSVEILPQGTAITLSATP